MTDDGDRKPNLDDALKTGWRRYRAWKPSRTANILRIVLTVIVLLLILALLQHHGAG